MGLDGLVMISIRKKPASSRGIRWNGCGTASAGLYQRVIKLPNLTVDWNVDTFPELQAISVGEPVEWQAAHSKILGLKRRKT